MIKNIFMSVSLENGKYTFIAPEGECKIYCYRHGEPWIVFEQGAKALLSLMFAASSANAAERKDRTMKKAREMGSTDLSYIPGIDHPVRKMSLDKINVLERQLAVKDNTISKLADALQELVDQQNGPPLIRDEKEWQAAMDRAAKTLSERDETMFDHAGECRNDLVSIQKQTIKDLMEENDELKRFEKIATDTSTCQKCVTGIVDYCLGCKIKRQAAMIDILKDGLQEVIDFTPNDKDYREKPTRDECLEEIKYCARRPLRMQKGTVNNVTQ